jgi:hypothetical protein
LGDSFSISCWLKTPAAGFEKEWQAILTKGTKAGGAFVLTCVGTQGRVYFRVRGLEVANDHIYGTVFVDDGYWHHIVATCEYDGGSGEYKLALFIDGQEDWGGPVYAASGTPVKSLAPLLIGGSFGQFTVDGNLYIDDVYLFNKALTSSEVTTLRNLAIPGDLSGDSFTNMEDLAVMSKHWMEGDYTIDPDYGLVGHWDFSGSAGSTTVSDLVGDNDAVLMGGAVLDGSGAVDLAGGESPQYVDLGSDFGNVINELTSATYIIDMDWDGNGAGTWQKIWNFSDAGNSRHAMLTFVSTNMKYLRFQHRFDGHDEQSNGSDTFELTGRHQIAVVYNHDYGMFGYGRLFVDGEDYGFHTYTDETPEGNVFSETTNNWIGRGPYANPYLDARVYDFKVFNRALAPVEISNVYNNVSYSVYVPLEAPGNFSDEEAENSKVLDWNDLEVLVEQWLGNVSDLPPVEFYY